MKPWVKERRERNRKMTIKDILLEASFPLLLAGLVYVGANTHINITSYDRRYNSWSREEKIAYLEERLENPFYQSPPMMNPKTGGAISLWSGAKRELQEELNRLRNE